MIDTIHHQVKGRARYKIEGLYRCQTLKSQLEVMLNLEEDIISASGSTLTGNMLVSYNSDNTHATIAVLIEKMLMKIEVGAVIKAKSPEVDETQPTKQPDSRNGPNAPDACALVKSLGHLRPMESPDGRTIDTPWHLLSREEILEVLETDRNLGLSKDMVPQRRQKYGANYLPRAKGRSKWSIFLDSVNMMPTYFLSAAAAVSVLTGGFVEALVVMGVVVANVAIHYVTETKAQEVSESLKDLLHPSATVIREGRLLDIPVEEIVIGDVVILSPGTYIGADCRIIEAKYLSIDESMLTGESLPIFKNAATLTSNYTPLAERTNMAYMGTAVTGGQGIAIVVGTGGNSEMGCLQTLLNETEPPKSPIERQLERLGNQLAVFCGGMCVAVFLIGFLRGYGFLQMLKMAISLASAAIPEGLPMAATINFALGITKMRNQHVLIRRLQAVETIGAVQTICLDKTGTLTLNHMTVSEIFAGRRRISVANDRFLHNGTDIDLLDIEEMQRLLCTCTLCSETKINGQCETGEYELCGSATENALVHLAIRAGLDIDRLCGVHRLVDVQHRSERRPYMRTRHEGPDYCAVSSIKGSPAEVLSMCSHQMVDGEVLPLTDSMRNQIDSENERMSRRAMRVLGVAASIEASADGPEEVDQEVAELLVWLGLVGLHDPVRDGVQEVIDVLHRAGIQPVMITGDQTNTAYAVARELNISGDRPLNVVTSGEMAAADGKAMDEFARDVHVYSRVSPSHKLRIVQALQKAGRVVAMTGDGINDGPAIKASDLGIAMGKSGTDVAREVSDVVLQEDNLETLIVAIRDGRATHENIRKSLFFLLSTNLSEVMVIFISLALGLGFPLNVLQLLWLNIITDILPGLALSLEEPEADIMDRPPRNPDAPLFNGKDFRKMATEGGIITASALGAYAYGISRYGIGPQASSLTFQSLIFGQLLAAYSSRSDTRSIFDGEKQPPNPMLDKVIWGSLAAQALTLLFPPLRNFLGVTPIGLVDTAVIAGSAMLPLAVLETTKSKRTAAEKDPVRIRQACIENLSN